MIATDELKESTVSLQDNDEIQNLLTQNQISKLHNKFLKTTDKRMNACQLRDAIYQCSQIKIEEQKFKIMFLQIDSSSTGLASWDDFISYLINCLKNQEIGLEVKSLHTPIPKLPRMIRSNHRLPISQIIFKPQISPRRTFNYSEGEYMTMSKDGCINSWSVNLTLNKSFYSISPVLEFSNTVTTCFTILPDVSILCIATTENDLRFYDVAVGNSKLRLYVTHLDYSVTAVDYTFSQDINKESRLFFGDMGGYVYVLSFSPIERGPFRISMETPVYTYRFNELIANNSIFRYLSFGQLHQGWVRQVKYYTTIKFIISCSNSSGGNTLLMHKITNDQFYVYNQHRGVWCFAAADGKPLIASGGVECVVKVWNPFITKRPLITLQGHKTGITGLFFQDNGSILCSISEDSCLKVWDTYNRVCLQTYLSMGNQIGEYSHVTMFYNCNSRQIILGGSLIGILSLNSIPNADYTDGNTHIGAVSVLLYNPLFKVVVTCGLDSIIMVWDPWTGRRLTLIKQAHRRNLHGETINVDITAGCFDPGLHFLLTGATDGTLKTWNFNTGTCIRHLKIEQNCEVTGVFWLPDKILAMGWNKHITEFSTKESFDNDGVTKKSWKKIHTFEILTSAAYFPHTLVTGTYNGELFFWHLETSQPFRLFNVSEPTKLLKFTFIPENKPRERFKSLSLIAKHSTRRRSKLFLDKRRSTPSLLETTAEVPRGLAVRATLFLTSRPVEVGVGNLLVAVENGEIQVWSIHGRGGYLESFLVTHSIGDYVISMATDDKNEYLFLGTIEGYIKTFLLKGYFAGNDTKVSLVPYRLKFPFMWNTLINSRAKRALRHQPRPVLLNSYKAHLAIISKLIYLTENEILISASTDSTVRLWTLGGRYVGTLGTFKKWSPIPPSTPVDNDFKHTLPPDIKRLASSTTLRVLVGEEYKNKISKKRQLAELEKGEALFGGKIAHGRRITEPILGHHYKSVPSCFSSYDHNLRNELNVSTVYQQSIMPEPNPVKITDIMCLKKNTKQKDGNS